MIGFNDLEHEIRMIKDLPDDRLIDHFVHGKEVIASNRVSVESVIAIWMSGIIR
jgi:hypothetical protein